MNSKKKYIKPEIKVKKVPVSFFLSGRNMGEEIHDFFVPKAEAVYVISLPRTGCFLAGTSILLSDNTQKDITTLNVGDMVYSYNETTRELEPERIKEVLIHEDHPGGYLIINEKLKVTGNHRIFVNNQWKEADEIQIGDSFLNPQNQHEKVDSITFVEGNYTVYNLELEGANHNYFAENILVHNTIY